ncbi:MULTISPECIES: DUF4185 domain-containing protein [unclassified Streptomyces]|uniref:DUF4185 domain-containing protein n=1 Tax=unclassified Streptomyces TaxID=2593676 RepID=UPI00074790C0|nr:MULTISPECIES: DUF4185 domain-containing protein [unclassified Streptomyces]KUL53079.1 hypothetical protein ADL30_21095 [Streptomyces sp. NRRL S-1521]THC51357.1 DUF4185 domain-containing protein [Streptomyces sp. A1499]
MSVRERPGRTGRGTWLVLLLVLACAAVLLIALPEDERQGAAACRPRTVGAWSAADGVTGEFARYGDDMARTDDWTGGDGTHSVRLPDGRVLWLFSDTFLGRVHAPPNPAGQPHTWRDDSAPMVRNSAVVMSRSGALRRTLTAPLFPDPAPQQWRWPVAARVEPRSPDAEEKVVRVLLWSRMASQGPWIYGVPMATEVATLSLPDLRVESIVKVSDQQGVADPEKRVLYGTTTVDGDGWTYVFGGTDAQAASRPTSHAHLARVPHGRLADASAWEYWDGEEWGRAGASRPVLGDGGQKGVGSAFTVVREKGTYVLFTMAAGAKGLTDVTSYWACSPTGPWHGPAKAFEAPLPKDGAARQDTAAYNPQAHPALGKDGRVVLSYDVNWLDPVPASAQANVNRNVSLYRPRFVTLRLSERR